MESKWRVIFFLDYYLEDNKKKQKKRSQQWLRINKPKFAVSNFKKNKMIRVCNSYSFRLLLHIYNYSFVSISIYPKKFKEKHLRTP